MHMNEEWREVVAEPEGEMMAVVVMMGAHLVEEEGQKTIIDHVMSGQYQLKRLNSSHCHKWELHPPFQAHHLLLPRYVYAFSLKD